MNTRILGPGTRLLRLCLSRRLPIQPIHSSIPRSFSSMCSRLYADNVKRYTEQHEWIEIDGDDIGTVGITNYAQQLLGDVVFVELPPVDSFVNKGDELGAVESVKSASDIYAPLSGQVFEVNEELTSKPSLINKSAEGDGWICKIAVSEREAELKSLLTEEQYNEFLASQHDEEPEGEAKEESGKKDQ